MPLHPRLSATWLNPFDRGGSARVLMNEFHVVDLVSQREAVRQYIRGWSRERVLSWLASRGTLQSFAISGRDHYSFESAVGLRATFFFGPEGLVFVGDHSEVV